MGRRGGGATSKWGIKVGNQRWKKSKWNWAESEKPVIMTVKRSRQRIHGWEKKRDRCCSCKEKRKKRKEKVF